MKVLNTASLNRHVEAAIGQEKKRGAMNNEVNTVITRCVFCPLPL